MLRLWICGRIAGEVSGDPLPIPSGDRARALIGWLALHPGSHPRAAVAALLWPEVPDASARASLRTAVWAIRQSWGPVTDQVLDASRSSIGLRHNRFQVDALEDPASATGELLPGLDDDWVQQERAEHGERQSAALEDLATQAQDEGRIKDAVRWARRRCAVAPFDESAHRALLDRLEAAGDHAGAVLAARQFTEVLSSELGVVPSPATRAAQAQLQAGPSSAPVRLFGRATEVAALARLWRSAASGQGQVVVLTGESGIGKTSLLAELTHRVATAGGRTALSAGAGVGGETPFAAWLELATSLVTSAAPVPRSATWPVELSRLSPDLGAGLGFPQAPPAVAAPEIERLRVFESVLRLVEWSSADRPVLIALDDAHLADRASLRLTAHIGRRLGALPLLLVLIRRDRPARPEVDALLAELSRRSLPVTELEIGPIGDRDVAALVSASARLDDETLHRVVAAAEGNPLLAVESSRAIAAGGASPPPSLRSAVRATLGRLPPLSQVLARTLAAAARPLSGAELDGLGIGDSPGEVDTAAEAGIESGLLARPGGRLGFRHSLLREVVYADLPDPVAVHATLARALAEAGHDGSGRAEIAHHLTLAGRPAQAAGEWAAAAAHARSVGALAEAVDFLARACECAPGAGELWLELAEVCAWAGRQEEREQAWEQAVGLLAPEQLPAAWARRGRQFRSVVCHPEESSAAYRQAQDLMMTSSSRQVRADVLIGLAWSQAVAGDATEVEPLLAQAIALLPAEHDPQVLADIAEIRIFGLILQGRFSECGQIAAAIRLSELPDRAFAVWINAACALACAGDLAGALALADRAVEATRSVPVLLVSCLAAQAQLLARSGRAEEALKAVQEQRDQAARLDAPLLVATAAHDAGLIALELGRYPQAAQLLGEALADGAQVSRPAAAMARAEALARAGDPDAAAVQLRAAVQEPVARADQPWALVPRMAGIQGLIAAARGDVPGALHRFEEAAQGWRRMLGAATRATSDGFLANLVDLGRPPVVGLVEPARELARLEKEMVLLTDVPSHKLR